MTANVRRQPSLIAVGDLPRVPRQARSLAKRDAMLRAALNLFSARGYEAVGIEEIVAQAQTGVGSFYAYFRGKQQLLLVLMQEYLSALQGLNLLDMPLDREPVAAVAAVLRRALVPEGAYAGLWRAWQEAVLTHPDLQPVDQQIRGWMQAYVAAMIEAARPSGRLRPDLDVVGTARAINALGLQLAQIGPAADDALIDAAARMIAHAIFVDETT